jgi:hypothetical protein
MIDALYQLYLVAWVPVCLAAGLAGWRLSDRGLIRCATVTFVGQVILDMWFAFGPGMSDGKQPLAAYLLIYVLSCILVTIRPTTKLCSIFGGIFLGAVLICGIHGGDQLFGYGKQDKAFWINNLFIGWVLLLALIGGAGFDMGKSLVLRIHGALARFSGNAGKGGVG